MTSRKKTEENSSIEILIAEDSPTQAEALKQILKGYGYQVTVAEDGQQAIAEVRKRKPAVIISDIMMPEMDGYTFCKAVKSDDQIKDIPVILVTTLSDPGDIVKGLECGADNFIRKPYEEKYLLSRISYFLMNRELRKSEKVRLGVEISLMGQRHLITSERQQILDLLISTYEQAVHINEELQARQKELAHSNQVFNGLYRIAEGLNRCRNEQEVAEKALERAMELPGVQAGWISLREGEENFRLAATWGLPPALERPGALEGSCFCRRKLLSGELDHVTNIFECERLQKAEGDTRGLRYHAGIPLNIGDRTIGIMNLVGPEQGLFSDAEMRTLYSVGHQVAVAMERAQLQEHLERKVEEKTAALTAEIEERKRAEKGRARLAAILEATTDFVGIADLQGRAIYVNKAGRKMLGIGDDEDVSDLTISDCHPEWAIKIVLEKGIPMAIRDGVWHGETALLSRNGRETPISQVILAHKAPDGAVEFLSTIARDVTERKLAEEKILKLNADLERRVVERTAELEEANKELESFSYTVSHDLRAPLRGIDGFSQALMEDWGEKLDAAGKNHLKRVRAAARRMGELIDDLLNLSRVTRVEIRRERVDLSALAQTVAEELRKEHPERQVEFVIAKGVEVNGDSGLLRVAIENLLGNAWKYTSKHPRARIEFGVTRPDGKPAYFFRDDGAGFDMAYAGKLFGTFQRLHSEKEFSGTGIGLATVQRIIHRHGGRVWAEGAVDQGATIYFTLSR